MAWKILKDAYFRNVHIYEIRTFLKCVSFKICKKNQCFEKFTVFAPLINEDLLYLQSSGYSDELQMRSKYILVGWDSFRSKMMLTLVILLFVWATIYFPLLIMGYS